MSGGAQRKTWNFKQDRLEPLDVHRIIKELTAEKCDIGLIQFKSQGHTCSVVVVRNAVANSRPLLRSSESMSLIIEEETRNITYPGWRFSSEPFSVWVEAYRELLRKKRKEKEKEEERTARVTVVGFGR